MRKSFAEQGGKYIAEWVRTQLGANPDVGLTRLLLGLGLRSFSMHPAQILAVKQEVLRADAQRLVPWAQDVLNAEDPAQLMAG